MRRLSWLGVGVAVAALSGTVAVTPASGVAASAHPDPPYVDSAVSHFVLYANSHWHADDSPAPQFSGDPAAPNHGYQVAGGDTPHYIWADTCSKGKQTVTFRRKVWLPGPSQSLNFQAAAPIIHSGLDYWSDPFRSIKLIANGEVLAKLTRSGSGIDVDPATVAHAVAYGDNVFQVVVQKRPNPDYIRACSGRHAPARLGIQFSIYGSSFMTDLAVKQPVGDNAVRYFHVHPGDHHGIQVNFSVLSDGPAAAKAGVFDLVIQPGFMVMSSDPANPYFPAGGAVLTTSSSPFDDCAHPSARHITCPFNTWFAPRTPSKVYAGWIVAAPTDEPDNAVGDMTVNWSIERTTNNSQNDTDYANNTAHAEWIFCYPSATTHGCDTH